MKDQARSMSILKPFLLSGFLIFFMAGSAQMITGVWHGKINGQRVEVKLIQKGDSLTGTSYYYNGGSPRRYTVKGYLNYAKGDNNVVWWDDQLLSAGSAKTASYSEADFNCPDGSTLKLNGTGPSEKKVNLTKVGDTDFPDPWDWVLDNFTIGANDPDIIDSIQQLVAAPRRTETPADVAPPRQEPAPPVAVVTVPPPTPPAPPVTIEEKFVIRKKVFTTEIPLAGDSIELRFFDNVQVDGDSITLFLNDKLIFTHIRLTEKAFVVKLPVNELADSNELTMVAENLGAIPPNTAYLVAIVDGKYYNINLSSTEETSGMIRLVKPKKE